MKKQQKLISWNTKEEELNSAIYQFSEDVLTKIEMTEVQRINTQTFLKNIRAIILMK